MKVQARNLKMGNQSGIPAAFLPYKSLRCGCLSKPHRSEENFGCEPPLKSRLAGTHADILDGLEQLPFRFDRGRDDNLGLLELTDGCRSDIAHASSDGTDQILAAIIHNGGAEENLLE